MVEAIAVCQLMASMNTKLTFISRGCQYFRNDGDFVRFSICFDLPAHQTLLGSKGADHRYSLTLLSSSDKSVLELLVALKPFQMSLAAKLDILPTLNTINSGTDGQKYHIEEEGKRLF